MNKVPKVGDVYHGLCCDNFGWVVCDIWDWLPDYPTEVLGFCKNPECPNGDFGNDDWAYIGISTMPLERFDKEPEVK